MEPGGIAHSEHFVRLQGGLSLCDWTMKPHHQVRDTAYVNLFH
jgi:hypothetical protein